MCPSDPISLKIMSIRCAHAHIINKTEPNTLITRSILLKLGQYSRSCALYAHLSVHLLNFIVNEGAPPPHTPPPCSQARKAVLRRALIGRAGLCGVVPPPHFLF